MPSVIADIETPSRQTPTSIKTGRIGFFVNLVDIIILVWTTASPGSAFVLARQCLL